MSDIQPRTPYLGRYLAVSAAAMVGLGVLSILIRVALGVTLPGGAVAIIPPMIAALHVGQTWGRERAEVPDNRTAWRWAAVAGLIYFSLQMLIVPVVLARADHAPQLIALVAGVVGGVTVIAILLHRVFVVIGAKGTVAGPRA